MGTLCNTVQHRLERLRQKQMKHDEVTQQRWVDAATYFRERDKKYGTTKLLVPSVVHLPTVEDAPSSALTTLREPMGTLDSVPGRSQIPQLTSRTRCSYMRLRSRKPQILKGIPALSPDAAPVSLVLKKSKPVARDRFFPPMSRAKRITI